MVLGGDLQAQIAHIPIEPTEELLVLGSPTLVRWLLAYQLLKTLTFTLLPMIIGSGVRLFQDMALPSGPVCMQLISAQPLAWFDIQLSVSGQGSPIGTN